MPLHLCSSSEEPRFSCARCRGKPRDTQTEDLLRCGRRRCSCSSNRLLRRRCALVNVGQEADSLIGLVELLKLRLPRGFDLRLLLSLLRLAKIEQEALLLLRLRLGQLAQSGLPQAKRTERFALLKGKATILRAKAADAFAKTAHELLTLKAKRSSLLCTLQAKRSLALPELAGLLSKLPRQLLSGEPRLTGRLRDLRLSLRPLQAHLARLSGKLTCQLGGGHARLRGKRFEVDAVLSQSLSVCRSKLLARQAKLTGSLRST